MGSERDIIEAEKTDNPLVCHICGLDLDLHEEADEHCPVCKAPIGIDISPEDIETLGFIDNGWHCERCNRQLCPRCEGQPGMYSDGCALCDEQGYLPIVVDGQPVFDGDYGGRGMCQPNDDDFKALLEELQAPIRLENKKRMEEVREKVREQACMKKCGCKHSECSNKDDFCVETCRRSPEEDEEEDAAHHRLNSRLIGVLHRYYDKRNVFKDKNGYIPYRVILNVHARALRKLNGKYTFFCERCDNWFSAMDGSGGILHHKDYPGKGRETENDLLLLCNKCHSKAHGR